MKPVIYADTLFLFNFLMNTIVLVITARFLCPKTSVFRIGLAAAMGAVYSVLMFFPEYGILFSIFLKILILFGIEFTAFGGKSFFAAVKNFLVFLLVNISLGGGLMALIFLTDFGTAVGSVVSGGGIYINLSPLILIFGIVGIYILLGVYQKMSKRRLFEKSLIKRVKIQYRGRMAEINLFLDTGCRICDPVNDRAAVIAEYDAVKLILDEKEREIIENGGDIMKAFENGMRVIPYSTLGGDNVIFGIIADNISGENFSQDKITVGITADKKFGEEYRGVINPELLLQRENISEVCAL